MVKVRLSLPLLLVLCAGSIIVSVQPAQSGQILNAFDIEPSTGPLPAEFQTLSTISGDTIDLTDTTPYTIVNFWATWCVPCRDELKTLNRLHEKYKSDGLRIIAVNVGETTATVNDFTSKLELSLPVVLDTNRDKHRLFDDSEFFQLPRSLFVQSGGTLLSNFPGALEFDTERVHKALRQTLTGNKSG